MSPYPSRLLDKQTLPWFYLFKLFREVSDESKAYNNKIH